MGLLSGLVSWPLLPVKGVVTVGRLIQEEAEQQWRSPATVRKELEELEELPMEEQQAAMEELTQEWLDSQRRILSAVRAAGGQRQAGGRFPAPAHRRGSSLGSGGGGWCSADCAYLARSWAKLRKVGRRWVRLRSFWVRL